MVVFLVSCGSSHDNLFKEVEQIKKEIMASKDYCEDDVLQTQFKRTLNIIESKKLIEMIDSMREKAYEIDKEEEWNKLDRYVAMYKPIIKIIIGGEANYISPDMEYFMSKSKPNSVSNKFFSLSSKGGWYDRKGILHGGTQYGNFPDWIIPKTGIEGEYDYGVAKEYLSLWQKLQPELNGVYREVADNTINELNKICENK